MANTLQLKPINTEVMLAHRQHQVPLGPELIGNTSVPTVSNVCGLGVEIDSDLTLPTHVTATGQTYFSILRQIRCVRKSLTYDELITHYQQG